MVEGQPWRSPKKLIQEAHQLQLSIKEAQLDNDLPYSEIVGSRTRLRDIYRSLLVTDLELSLDQKIEQDLWNNCFKNPINELLSTQKSKTAKTELRQEAAYNYSELLESAYGFYVRLLDDICEAYSLELPNRATDRQLKMMPNIHDSGPAGDMSPPRATSSLYIAQHCLIHLGDIARYRHNSRQQKIADSYYRKAAQLVPSSGHPYNQLAILAAGSPDNLQTVYFYFRAMYVKCPFPVSKDNLARQFDKVLKSPKSKITKKASQISVLELIRLFLKFQASCFLSKDDDFSVTKMRLISAIEFHRSLGSSLSRRQLLQMSFITIANYHRAKTNQNEMHTEMLDFLLEFLDILIRLPVDPQRHLPSVLTILQFFEQNISFLDGNQSQTWLNLAVRLNNTLPKTWGSDWQPKIAILPEDLDFKGWTLWRMPPTLCTSRVLSSESDQTDARAERILFISRQLAKHPEQDVMKLENEIFVSPIKPREAPVPEVTPVLATPTEYTPFPMAPIFPKAPRADLQADRPPLFYPTTPPPTVQHDFKTPLLQATGPDVQPPVRYSNAPPVHPSRIHIPPPKLPPPSLPIHSPNGEMNIPPNIMDFLRHIPPPSFTQDPTTPTELPQAGPFGSSSYNHRMETSSFPTTTTTMSSNDFGPIHPPFPPALFPPPSNVPAVSHAFAGKDERQRREPWQHHRKTPSSPGGTDFFPIGEPSFFDIPSSSTQPIGFNRPVSKVEPINSSLYFPSTSFTTPKPVLDPDSYDRKLSPFWDPTTPQGYQTSRDIWAPPTTSTTSLDLDKLIINPDPLTRDGSHLGL